MTVLHDDIRTVDLDAVVPTASRPAHLDYPARRAARPIRVAPRAVTRRPRGGARPAGAALRHSGTGVRFSRAAHRRRPITAGTTVGLAVLAALITVWLGLVGQFGGLATAPEQTAAAETLAVVRVQPGETLDALAARVSPQLSTDQAVVRIRDLNMLESAPLQAGQTLIAPIG